MRFVPYILDRSNKRVAVTIALMEASDAALTESDPKWQTPWTSSFLSTDAFRKYAFKADDELVALGAYEIQENALIVHIVYMEAAPESNPTIVGVNRKAPDCFWYQTFS